MWTANGSNLIILGNTREFVVFLVSLTTNTEAARWATLYYDT